MSDKVKSLVSLDQIEAGPDLKTSIGELFDKVKDINPEDYRKIADRIDEDDLSPNLYKLILEKSSYDDTDIWNQINILKEIKAARTELSNYRKKIVKIQLSDLDQDVLDKLIDKEYGPGYVELRSDINYLYDSKLDRIEALDLRRKEDCIVYEDLDEYLQSQILLIAKLDLELEELANSVISKDNLKRYREKSISINYDDLTSDLQGAIDRIDEIFAEIRDFNKKINVVIKTYATKHELNKKIDSELAYSVFREKAESIKFDDLSEDLKDILDSIAPEFDSRYLDFMVESLQKNKADIAYVDTYFRKITEPIYESNLDPNLIAKINHLSERYDDTNVLRSINTLEKHKADLVLLQNYHLKEEPIERKHLSTEVQSILTTAQHHDQEIRQHYFDLRETKADKTQLELYRRKDTLISESDLTEAFVRRIQELERKLIEKDQEIASLQFKVKANELSIAQIKNEIGLP